MTLNQIAALAADTTFQSQIRSAAVFYAHTVIAEAPGTHAILQQKRYALAQSLLADGGVSLLTRMVWGIATVPGFSAVAGDQGSANDAAINSAMITAWNDLALVTDSERLN